MTLPPLAGASKGSHAHREIGLCPSRKLGGGGGGHNGIVHLQSAPLGLLWPVTSERTQLSGVDGGPERPEPHPLPLGSHSSMAFLQDFQPSSEGRWDTGAGTPGRSRRALPRVSPRWKEKREAQKQTYPSGRGCVSREGHF